MKTLNIILTGLLMFGSFANAKSQPTHSSAQGSSRRYLGLSIGRDAAHEPGADAVCGNPDNGLGQFAVYKADEVGQRAGLILYQGKIYQMVCEWKDEAYICSTETGQGIFAGIIEKKKDGTFVGSATIVFRSGEFELLTTMSPCSFNKVEQQGQQAGPIVHLDVSSAEVTKVLIDNPALASRLFAVAGNNGGRISSATEQTLSPGNIKYRIQVEPIQGGPVPILGGNQLTITLHHANGNVTYSDAEIVKLKD